MPFALSSIRFPSLHPGFPTKQFVWAEQMAFVAPQMYWLGAHNPGEQLERCHKEYNAIRTLGPSFPMIPIGSSWGQDVNKVYWEPTASDIQEFIATPQKLGCPAWGFWSLDWIWEHKRNDWLKAMGGKCNSPTASNNTATCRSQVPESPGICAERQDV